MKPKNNVLPYLILSTISLGIGYIGGKSHTSQKYEIDGGYISYEGKYERQIKIESEKIIVGSLKERISDLLLESPGKVKSTTEELLYEEYK